MPVSDADGWYEDLMNAQAGLSEPQRARFNCALVLLLADRVGDPDQLRQCVAEARTAALQPGGIS